MTRRQRRMHRLAWTLLAPALCGLLVAAVLRRDRAGLAERAASSPNTVEVMP